MSTSPHVNKLKAAMQGMAAVEALPAMEAPEAAPSSQRAPSRLGKRVVSAYIAPAAAKQLRLLAAETDRSTQALVEEALNDLFRKYNKSAIA